VEPRKEEEEEEEEEEKLRFMVVCTLIYTEEMETLIVSFTANSLKQWWLNYSLSS
jgi:hypothetical protein